MDKIELLQGDCLHLLPWLEDNSVDSVVTDPPYGLAFMGKKWDYQLPSLEIWKEVFRVLKPGGYLLAFGGPRTYHRMACGVEDAGFEVRDQLQWLFGSGFPKSLDVSKAIDKAAGAERKVIGKNLSFRPNHLKTMERYNSRKYSGDTNLTTAATDDAKQWAGWGTALKPANEPILLARKPLSEKTVAANVLKWGTGGLNIDGCRIAFKSEKDLKSATFGTQPKITSKNAGSEGGTHQGYRQGVNATNVEANPTGRFPANLLLDSQAAQMLDAQSGTLSGGGPRKGPNQINSLGERVYGKWEFTGGKAESRNAGGASRFFYVAKSSKREKGVGNSHPTVKPIKLMRYLCRLITPVGGVVLDPFLGSGSTGIAALQERFGFIGIEREKVYFSIAEKRIAAWNR